MRETRMRSAAAAPALAALLRVVLAAVLVGGAATAQEAQETQDGASEPPAVGAVPEGASNNRVAVSTAWSVFVETDPALECWGVSAPQDTVNRRGGEEVDVRRGDILLFVAYRPAAGVAGEVSFTGGYPFAENSAVTLQIGPDRFEMFTRGEFAWPVSNEDDARIVDAMRRGREVTLTGRSARGTETQDTFSLMGFTAALGGSPEPLRDLSPGAGREVRTPTAGRGDAGPRPWGGRGGMLPDGGGVEPRTLLAWGIQGRLGGRLRHGWEAFCASARGGGPSCIGPGSRERRPGGAASPPAARPIDAPTVVPTARPRGAWRNEGLGAGAVEGGGPLHPHVARRPGLRGAPSAGHAAVLAVAGAPPRPARSPPSASPGGPTPFRPAPGPPICPPPPDGAAR